MNIHLEKVKNINLVFRIPMKFSSFQTNSNLPSINSNLLNTRRKFDSPEEIGSAYHPDDSSFSDFIHYITKSGSVPYGIRLFLFILLAIQLPIASLCPPFKQYWGPDPILDRIVSLLGYVTFVQAPPINSISFMPLLITCYSLFFLEELIINAIHSYYVQKRYLNKILCHFVIFLSLLVSNVLSPFICALSGRYLAASFHKNDEFQVQIGVSLLSAVVLFYSFGRSISLNLFLNFTISFNDALFQTWKSEAPTRILGSLGLITFLSPIFTSVQSESPIIYSIILFIALINCVMEIVYINWNVKWQFVFITSSLITSVTTSLALLIDVCLKDWQERTLMFWLTPVVFILSWLFVPLYHKFMVKRAMKALSDPSYAMKVKSVFHVLRDFSIGFQYDHPAIMCCTHVKDIIDRFPDSFDLFIFLARFSLTCNTCPISMGEIGRRLVPIKAFSPIKAHVFVSITRLMAPISNEELEVYNKLVVSIRRSLYRLLASGKQIYDFILDELTGTLPSATLSFSAIYEKTVYRLFRFIQRYPGSPEGEFFIHLFENLFPDSKELPELKRWHNYHPDYVRISTSIYPSHMKMRLEMPEIFRSYRPEYLNDHVSIVEPLEHEPDEDDEKKLLNVRGPYEHVIRKWYVYLILFFGLLLPIALTPILIAQNKHFRLCNEHLLLAWSLIWKFERMNTYIYASTFFSESEELWSTFSDVNYSDWKHDLVDMITYIQSDFLHISTGFGGTLPLNRKILKRFTDFFKHEITSPLIEGNFSISHGLLSTTFIADEMLSIDSVYLSQYGTIVESVKILRLISDLLSESFDLLAEELNNINIFEEPIIKITPFIVIVLEVALLVFVFIFISVILYAALFRSNLFFMTLRETSKSAVAHVRSYFIKQQDIIGSTSQQRQKTYSKRLFSYFFDFLIPALFIAVCMIALVIMNFLFYSCYNRQLERKFEIYRIYTHSYVNVSRAIQYHEEIVFKRQLDDVNVSDLTEKIDAKYKTFGLNVESWSSDETSICPLCDRRQLYMLESPSNSTFETAFFDWLSALSLSIHTEVASDFLTPFQLNVSVRFFNYMETNLLSYLDELENICDSNNQLTLIWEIITFILYISFVVIFIIFLAHVIHKSDAPFRQMVKLLRPIPEKSLSRDTLQILAEHFWDFTVDHFEFDPSYYDTALQILPDAVIVIDQTRTILSYNQAAGNIIDIEQNAVNENLFDALQIDLKEVSEDSNNSESNENVLSFQDIVNDYLFDDHSSLPSYKLLGRKDSQSYWYALTILPIFDESPEQVITQVHGADHFALIFRDIGDEICQQNLLEEETKKHMSIVQQILPAEIATRLLREPRSISMTVDKVAIAFCDIVSFTPWCSSHTAEFVVNALNLMFKTFDEFCQNYNSVTKIKCIGDCYMSAAGVFSQGQDPTIAARQMVHFCLDSIDGIGVVNKALNTALQVRIGIAYGGPISAGVLGIHKPVFDIWGETVNEAQTMESSGMPMMVHIEKELYIIVCNEPFIFKPKGDETWLVKRNTSPEDEDLITL
ncbi:adenylate and guanylate cyclase [Tritrichomonas foetus]|uniref:Adenylate and guanylate cyclase n=1 Tax=Tritrichomonas foetus TaxID=1144522 RepID=A0A1J4K8L3_9EUKA|nr:adenylate and guanylate cyclase [Tritrichomonas foetus]|eukprot:OHT07306.1 adenylate and guanylate cyclase [Tritrichomonas foetus]